MNIQKKKEAFGIRLLKNIRKHWILYLMVTPVVLYYIIFSYVPMYGVLLAFKEYEIKKGILGSPWVLNISDVSSAPMILSVCL